MAGGKSGQLTRRETSELADSDLPTDEERVLKIRESMEDSRRQIAESLEQVRSEMKDAVDVGGWIDEHPWETVGIAFSVGFFIGFR